MYIIPYHMSKQNVVSEPIVKIQDIEEKQKTARERRQERRRAMQERAERRKAERDEVNFGRFLSGNYNKLVIQHIPVYHLKAAQICIFKMPFWMR